MPVSLICPNCMAGFQLEGAKAGQNVKCPECGVSFFVPPQATQPAPPPPVQKTSKVKPPAVIPTATVGRRPAPRAVHSPALPAGSAGSPASKPAIPWKLVGFAAVMAVGLMIIGLGAFAILFWWMTSAPEYDKARTIAKAKITDEPIAEAKLAALDPEKAAADPSPDPAVIGGEASTKPATKMPDPPSQRPTIGPNKTAPPTTTQYQKSLPGEKRNESDSYTLIPIDLGNLAKSDKLSFILPPPSADDSTTPAVWDGHTNHIRGVSFNHDGRLVVSVSGDVGEVLVDGQRRPADNSIRVWDARRGMQVHKLDGFVEPLDGLSVSPGGRFAVFGDGGHYEGKIFIAPKHSHLRMFDIQNKVEIPFAPMLEGNSGAATVGNLRGRFQGLTGSIFCSAFSPDLQYVLGGSNSRIGQLTVWNSATGQVLAKATVPTSPGWASGVMAAHFAFNGRFIVLLSDYKVWVIDAMTGQTSEPLVSHKDETWALAVSEMSQGRWLAISGGGSKLIADGKGGNRFDKHFKDYGIRLWDVGQRKLLKEIRGHQDDVVTLAFRPKTHHFLSGSMDRTVCLWDWESGKLLRTYRGHTNVVRSVAVAPDGRVAVSGGDDCTVRYWQLPGLAEDLVAAVQQNDPAKLENLLPDMDAMGPELRTAFAPLVRGLGHDSAAMRRVAGEALVRMGEMSRSGQLAAFAQSDFKSLLTLLKTTENPELLLVATSGLAQLGPDAAEAAPALVKIADSKRETKIVAAALRALGAIQATTVAALAAHEKHLDDADAEIRDTAALALLQVAPQRLQLARLTNLVGSTDADVRTLATKGLRQKLAATKDLRALRQGLNSPVIEVRLVYIDAIGSLKEDASDAVPDLVLLLSATDNRLALETLRALKNIGPSAKLAVPAVVKLAGESKDQGLALESVVVLGKLDPSNPFLANKFNLLIEGLKPDFKALDGLKPDFKALRAFLAQPLDNPSAQAILDMGTPAVDLLVKEILNRNNPKTNENQAIQPTAMRYAAYVMLKELAKKAVGDGRLNDALKAKQEVLGTFRRTQEAKLATQAARLGLPAEVKELYSRTARAADQAHYAIIGLPETKKK